MRNSAAAALPGHLLNFLLLIQFDINRQFVAAKIIIAPESLAGIFEPAAVERLAIMLQNYFLVEFCHCRWISFKAPTRASTSSFKIILDNPSEPPRISVLDRP